MATEESFTEAQLLEFREAFNLFDKDGNGKITMDELATVLKSLDQSHSLSELSDVINEVDADGDGEIDFSEFLAMMTRKMTIESDRDEEVEQAFAVFDKNGDGFISPDELRQVMAQLGEPLTEAQLAEMMRVADSSGDGLIDKEEFVAMMKSRGI